MFDIQKLALLNRVARVRNSNTDKSAPTSADDHSNKAEDCETKRLIPVVRRNVNANLELDLDIDIDLDLDLDLDLEADSTIPDSAATINVPEYGSSTFQPRASKSAQIHEFPGQIGRMENQTLTHQGTAHTLPVKSLRKHGLLLPDSPRCSLGEQYRNIKRSLLLNIRNARSVNKPMSSIMVTSALSGEGKTFTALNLALSFSQEHNHSVIFIDADVLKSSASRIMGFDKESYGLTDFLAGEIDNPFMISHATQYANLRVVPSGRKHANTTELLSTRRMSDLLASYCQDDEERVIILDAPPLLQTTQACVLADHVGQVAFVVSSASTGRTNVKAALAKLSKEMQVGIVINKLRHFSNDARYNYSYN